MSEENLDELQKELDQLNEIIKNALYKRTKLIDDNFHKFCKYKVGDEVYDLDTGEKFGNVYRLERTKWRGTLYDTRFSCDVQSRAIGETMCIDNVLPYKHCTKQEAIERQERKLNKLKNGG